MLDRGFAQCFTTDCLYHELTVRRRTVNVKDEELMELMFVEVCAPHEEKCYVVG
jgi:hypothetical protein